MLKMCDRSDSEFYFDRKEQSKGGGVDHLIEDSYRDYGESDYYDDAEDGDDD
jgi:hypothetical protein